MLKIIEAIFNGLGKLIGIVYSGVNSLLGIVFLGLYYVLAACVVAAVVITSLVLDVCAVTSFNVRAAVCVASVIFSLIIVLSSKGRSVIGKDINKYFDDWLYDLPGCLSMTIMLTPLLYYPSAFFTGFFVTISGSGSNLSFFSGAIDKSLSYGFSNYMQWTDSPKYLCAFVVVKLLMRIVAALLRLRPLRALRSIAFTVDFVLLGAVCGYIWLFMAELSNENILLLILCLVPMWCFYLGFVYLITAFLMPAYIFILPLLLAVFAPFLGLAGMAGAVADGVAEAEYEGVKTDLFVHGEYGLLTALERAEAGHPWLLTFLTGLEL